MFFWFPINTDAPVYHFPWATISLIAANCLAFAAGQAGLFPLDEFALHYGRIAPWEWVTSNFLHEGYGHLLGNMFFLWSVGLIVEGKLGWRAFTLIYLGIGITQCAIEQTCMLGAEGSSLGASAIVFGLTAIALVWAPKNEISFVYLFWFLFVVRAGVKELSVMTYAAFVLVIELLFFAFQGFHIGTSALHLMGAVLGFAVGAFMLRHNFVDCEGWDLFSVMKGTHGRVIGDPTNVGTRSVGTKRKKRRKKRKPSRMLVESSAELPVDTPPEEEGLSRTERSRRKILRHISENKPRAALTELQRQQHLNSSFRLDAGHLRRLAQGLIEHEQWNEAITLIEEYLERFDAGADAIRLQLAILLMQKQRRPQAALKVLNQIDDRELSDKLHQRKQQIERAANQLIDSGVIELSGQAFQSE